MISKEFHYLMLDQKLLINDLDDFIYKKEIKKIVNKERSQKDDLESFIKRLQNVKNDIEKKLIDEEKIKILLPIFDRIERIIKDE